MTNTLRYEFEELPLVIKGGFEAGLVTGEAEIAYRRDGSWSVEEIYLGGYRLRSPAECATMRMNGIARAADDAADHRRDELRGVA